MFCVLCLVWIVTQWMTRGLDPRKWGGGWVFNFILDFVPHLVFLRTLTIVQTKPTPQHSLRVRARSGICHDEGYHVTPLQQVVERSLWRTSSKKRFKDQPPTVHTRRKLYGIFGNQRGPSSVNSFRHRCRLRLRSLSKQGFHSAQMPIQNSPMQWHPAPLVRRVDIRQCPSLQKHFDCRHVAAARSMVQQRLLRRISPAHRSTCVKEHRTLS